MVTATKARKNSKKKELEIKVDSSLQKLLKNIERTKETEDYKKMVKFFTSFHRYSFLNTLSIYFHRPDATMVKGYKQWQKFGRYVRKGEKGIPILVPFVYEDDTTTETKVFFAVRYVFDVKQTEGDPIPELDWITKVKDGDLEGILVKFATKKEISINYVDKIEGHEKAQGFSKVSSDGKKQITILKTAGVSVMVHELAHLLLGHFKLKLDQTIEETEAESVAFLVLDYFGMSEQEQINYVAYYDFQNGIKESLERIKKVSSEIIGFVEKQYLN